MTEWEATTIALLLLVPLVIGFCGVFSTIDQQCNTRDWTKEPPPKAITLWYKCK